MTRTPEQQRAIVDRILAAWLRMPALRFGQLVNAAADRAEHDAFYIRDEALCEAVEALAAPPPMPSEVRQIEEVVAAVFDQQMIYLGISIEKPESRDRLQALANEYAMTLARVTDALSALTGWPATFSFTDDYPSLARAMVDGLPLDASGLAPGSAAALLLRCRVPDKIASRFAWWPAPSSVTLPR